MEMQESPWKGQPEGCSGQFYVQHLISPPTTSAPIYPIWDTHKPATTSSNLFSSLFKSQCLPASYITFSLTAFSPCLYNIPTCPALTPVFLPINLAFLYAHLFPLPHLYQFTSIQSLPDHLLCFCLSSPTIFILFIFLPACLSFACFDPLPALWSLALWSDPLLDKFFLVSPDLLLLTFACFFDIEET